MSDILAMTIYSLQGECVSMLARRTKHANFRQEYCGMKNYMYTHYINTDIYSQDYTTFNSRCLCCLCWAKGTKGEVALAHRPLLQLLFVK